MNNEDKYKLYDEIVSATIHNLFNFARNTNRIVLLKYDKKNIYSQYLFEVGLVTCTLSPRDEIVVVLNMSLPKYLLFKLTHWKNRKFIRRLTILEEKDEAIDPYMLCEFMSNAFNVPITMIKDIYNEYYKKN